MQIKGEHSTSIAKATAHIVVEIVDYAPSAITSTVIVKKMTGEIIAMAFDKGKALQMTILPFDRFIMVLEGIAEIIIDKVKNRLVTGNVIIVPAHANSSFLLTSEQFKIMQTVIKSGYEL